jgi:hypothetical protein
MSSQSPNSSKNPYSDWVRREFLLRNQRQLHELYKKDENGISPVAQMQQNLIELVSIAATASVMAFALHHPDVDVALDSFKLPFSNSEFDIATLKKPTIEETIQAILQETYVGKGSDTPLYHYGSFLGTVSAAPAANNATPIEESDPYSPLLSGSPVTAEVMKESVERLNEILQSHLEVVVAPGEGYKKEETALRKLTLEKGSLHKMTDLARINVVFNDSRLGDIFSQVSDAVAEHAQTLPGNPLECSGFDLGDDRFQPSAYYGRYGYWKLLNQRCEVQICHKSMWDVYKMTHDIYDIERILDEIDVIRRQEQEASQSLSGEQLQERVSDLKAEKEEKIQKIKKAFTPLKTSLDAFVVKLLPDMSHPKLNQEGAWFQKITHHVMALLGEKGESVAETFQQKRKSFDEAAGLVFKPSEEDSEEDQDRHLQELGEQAWELRQLCHLVSVYGRSNVDKTYKERYRGAVVGNNIEMVNKATDLDRLNKEGFKSRINVSLSQYLERWGILERTVINPNNPRDFLKVLVGQTANTTRQ